ncbi:MAG TPA: hypothetical protein VG777_04655, partial [Thermoanaerobaculia bacterium]|nr:hypothetical protein [Thermoanaerobaculia bacterium]
AVYATVFFALAAFGRLCRVELSVTALAGVAAAAASLVREGRSAGGSRSVRTAALAAVAVAAALAGAFFLGLYPPTAFDETLYHLPTVGAFAASGRMPFVASLRVPVFPNAAEALEVPLLLFGGDPATHLLALLAAAATALLAYAAAAEEGEAAGWLAAALFLSSPIVVHLASTGYVEAPLTLFCFASYVLLVRPENGTRPGRIALAGALAGEAAAVTYLGLPWVAGIAIAAAALSPRGKRLRAAALSGAMAFALLGPWYARIVSATGNPVFPFLPGVFGHGLWDPVGLPRPGALDGLRDLVRLPWDTVFARARVNHQPPFSPWFLLASPLLVWRAIRDLRARIAAAVCLAWGALWLAMPRDSRYLAVVLPILSVETARAAAAAGRRFGRRLAPALAALAVSPGIAYAGLRIAREGPLPGDAAARDRYLAAKVPAWRAVAFLNRSDPGGTVFVCGGEQLRWYFSGKMIGDLAGIARYDRILSAPDGPELARRLDALGVRWILRARAGCRAAVFDRADFPYRTVYSDAGAEVDERIR